MTISSSNVQSQIEDKLSHANRDKSDLESQLEDNEEEINDLMKKYKASINQVCVYQERSFNFRV